MAGFPSRFGTGMSPMGGLQPTNPTPTLPPLQTPAGNTAPPVGAPIPLSTSKTPGVVGYGGSSAGRDNFSKYLQKMNTSAPLALNRGGPVKMREGGMVQQQGFLPPMDLSRPAKSPLFGGTMHMGPTMGGLGGGGISGALEPLKRYITTQVQQQNNEKIGPFVDGIVQNVEQEFGLQSGGMTAQPAITQMPSMNRPSLGLGYGNFPMPALNRVPFQGRPQFMPFRGITPRGGFDSPFRGRALGYADGGAVPRQTMIEDQPHMLAYIDPEERSMLEQMGGSGQPGPGGVPAYARRDGPGSENFGSEARDFQDELDRIEEEQRQNDADDREAAEAALRAATEQRIAAQFPQPNEIEVMNTAGYDKEPTSYPSAGRDSFAGFGGGQLFSNRGGLEQPFDRTNRQMTNLGSPLSDYINNESAEGTFADSDVIDSIDLSGAKGSAAGAATLPSGFSGGLEDNTSVSKAMTEAQRKAFLGPDPVSARNSLAKKMQNLNDMAFLRSELNLPAKTGIGSSADEFIDAMGDRFGTDFSLTSDQLYPATQEFKSRSISPFDFDRSSLDNLGNVIESSGSSALTSGPLGGDPFKPLRGASIGGSSQGTPDDLVPTLDSYGTREFNAFGEGVTPGAPVGTFDFSPTDEQIPEEVDFMFGTEDLADQTPTPRDFNRFDFVEKGRDLNRANEPFSSLGGLLGEDMSDKIIDEIPYDASFEREPAVPTFTSASSGGSGLTSEPLGGDPFAPTRDARGYIPPTPYDASFPTEPAVRANIPPDYKTLSKFELEQLSLDGDEIASNELRSRDDVDNQLSLDKYSVDPLGIGDPQFTEKFTGDAGVGQDDATDTFDFSVSQFAQPVGPEGVTAPTPIAQVGSEGVTAPAPLAQVGPEGITAPRPLGEMDSGMGRAMLDRPITSFDAPSMDTLFDPTGERNAIGGFEAIDEINDDLYEDEKDFEIVPFDLDNIVKDVQTGVFSEGFEFPDDEAIKLEKLFASATGNTKEVIEAIEADTNDKLYYEALDGLGKGNYKEETREELIKRLRDGERNQGWVRDIVSTVSKAHPVLFLADKLMIKLTQKDMKEQADLLDGKGLKDGQTAEAVRIQKGRHKGKYVGVVIKDEKGNIVEYKGHKVMPNQFDNKDALYDYILDDTFKPGPDDDDSPVVDDPCPPGFVLSGGVCVPIQSVGEDDDDVVEEDTATDDTPDTTETLDEIMARITNPSRTPSDPTETLRPITFANKGGEMRVDPLAGGAVQDSLASATQRFLNSLTG